MELIIDRVSKQYKNKIAVDRISVKLQPGVYGLLGANGAGKSNVFAALSYLQQLVLGDQDVPKSTSLLTYRLSDDKISAPIRMEVEFVHDGFSLAYGIEFQADQSKLFSKNLKFDLDATYSWTPSINEGEPISAADQSVGKQLPYVPEHSATVTGRISWKSWSFMYKWCFYSERFTMSSNDISLTGKLPEYYMNNVTIEKLLSNNFADFSIKGSINNLFDEEYLSVLSRPMPGINFELFLGITPKFF